MYIDASNCTEAEFLKATEALAPYLKAITDSAGRLMGGVDAYKKAKSGELVSSETSPPAAEDALRQLRGELNDLLGYMWGALAKADAMLEAPVNVFVVPGKYIDLYPGSAPEDAE